MSLLGMPFGWMLLGLAGLAGLLYLLQRLRVRHEEVPVVTTMFWKAAVEETRARVLVRRFKHPWAYALVLAIAVLIWIAMADPAAESESDTAYVLLLDGSAGMTRAGRYDAAKDALLDTVAEMPRASRRVLFCGAQVRPLLTPGEDALMLEKRLEGLAPEAAPASVARVIRRVAAESGDVVVRVFGDAPVPIGVAREGLRVERADIEPLAREANRGITAIGVTEAASGAFDRVDVLVEIRGPNPEPAIPTGSASFTGERLYGDATTLRIAYRDLPAIGRDFTVAIPPGDRFPLDDRATIVLPLRRPIRVALSPALERQFGPLLAADRAIVIDVADADVALRMRGEQIGGDVPALEVTPARDQVPAFRVSDPDAAADPDAALVRAAKALSLREIDAQSLAETAGRTIEVDIDPAPQRGISIWQELLGDPYDFVPSRAFPVFVAKAMRWLAGVPEVLPFVAAGEPLVVSGPVEDESGRTLDPVGARFVPDQRATYRLADGRRIAASLSDLSLSAASAPADGAMSPSDDPGGSATLVTWLLLLAFGLMLAEWHLFRTGRMP